MTPRSKPCCGNKAAGSVGESASRAFDGFRAATLQASPHGALRPGKCAIDRSHERRVSSFDNDARETAQDDLDPAYLIDAALGSVRIFNSNTDALDGRGELAELDAELAPDVGAFIRTGLDAGRVDVRGDHRDIHAARRCLAYSGSWG